MRQERVVENVFAKVIEVRRIFLRGKSKPILDAVESFFPVQDGVRLGERAVAGRNQRIRTEKIGFVDDVAAAVASFGRIERNDEGLALIVIADIEVQRYS